MIQCPNCGYPMAVDPANPNRMVCMTCGYVFDNPGMAWPVAQPVAEEEPPVIPQPVNAQGMPVVFSGEQAQVVTAASTSSQTPETSQFTQSEVQSAVQPQKILNEGQLQQEAQTSEQSLENSQQMPVVMPIMQQTEAQPEVSVQTSVNESYWGTKGNVVEQQQYVESAFVTQAQVPVEQAPVAQVQATPVEQSPVMQAQAVEPVQTLVVQEPVAQNPNARLPKGLAICALVLGILSFAGCWIPLIGIGCAILAIIAIIVGSVGRGRAKRGVASGGGMALAGVVLGVLAIIIAILVTAASVFVLRAAYNYEWGDNPLSVIMDNDGANPASSSGNGVSTPQSNASSATATPTTNPNGGAWISMSFTMNGTKFTLGEAKLSAFEQATGWGIDLKAAGYPNGYSVEPNEDITSVALTNSAFPNTYVSVDVINQSSAACDLKDCTLQDIVVQVNEDGNGSSDGSENFTFTVEEGIGIGSTLEQAIATFGEPSFTYNSDYDKYTTYTYEDASFSKELFLAASDGKTINFVQLTIH